MSVLEYTGLGLLLLALISVIVLMPKVPLGVRFWLWGWAAQLCTGPLQEISGTNPPLAFLSHGLSTLFPVMLLAGSYCFVNRDVPKWIFQTAGAMALVRGGFAAFGLFAIGRFTTLPMEIACYGLAAWVIVEQRLPRTMLGWLLLSSFIGFICVEIWDSFFNDPARDSGTIALPWVFVSVAAGCIHIFAWLDKSKRQTQAQERSATDRFDALVHHANDVIIELSASGHFLFVSPNSEPVLGYTPDALLGLSINEFVRENNVTYQDEPIAFDEPNDLAKLIPQGPWDRQFQLSHPNGTRHIIEIDGSEYFNANNELRIVAILRDITTRVEAEQNSLAHQKLESLGTMSAGIAHDFRNLLTTISGYTELIKLDLEQANTAEAIKHIPNVLAATEQASGLTDQLLTYAGKTPVELIEIDLAETLTNLRPLLKSAIADRARFDIELDEQLPVISANPVAIQQIVLNLVTNAVEAMTDRSGTISVRAVAATATDGESVIKIIVADDGEGIAAKTLPHIFEPFYTTKFTGRGLGLAALQGLVSAHNGRIDVDSHPGEGSTFTISLPTEQVVQEELTSLNA